MGVTGEKDHLVQAVAEVASLSGVARLAERGRDEKRISHVAQ
jgi:hypothetical protein